MKLCNSTNENSGYILNCIFALNNINDINEYI